LGSRERHERDEDEDVGTGCPVERRDRASHPM
jgi:hypothetical protein